MKAGTRDILKGVQHVLATHMPSYSYRVKLNREGTVTRVLCDRHVEELRSAGVYSPLTGEVFGPELCDACLEEQKKENEI